MEPNPDDDDLSEDEDEFSAEESLAIFECLDALPEAERLVVIACSMLGQTTAEAASLLNLPEATVRARLWRALAEVLTVLGHDERGKDPEGAAIIAPLTFTFTKVQRAAFLTFWSVEGRLPEMFRGDDEPR